MKITCYLHMWKYHRCYGFIINCTFQTKNYLSKMVWHFIGVYIINRTLHGCLEVWNFSSCVEKNISPIRCAHSWNVFQHSKRNLVSPCGHEISSITELPSGSFSKQVLQGSYPFLNKNFKDFSRTFKDTFPIFQGLHSVQKRALSLCLF